MHNGWNEQTDKTILYGFVIFDILLCPLLARGACRNKFAASRKVFDLHVLPQRPSFPLIQRCTFIVITEKIKY